MGGGRGGGMEGFDVVNGMVGRGGDCVVGEFEGE